ncbi:MAG: YhdH/YhfP family quinone oxidoreductase [Gammaproteobacteria bacterium]|nr:YhdH/YhfP family quinone oxidoreductase [Gammaproteobacteria bacterium]
MSAFRAFRINQTDGKIAAAFESLTVDDLTAGEVVIRVSWSGINFKDALAATGRGKILRQYPLNGGIDLAGTVMQSADPRHREGDQVLVCSAGLSETVDGGYSEVARVAADSVVPLPPGLSAREAMALGTAGFTAALAVSRMQHNGLRPDMGPVVVTGASGGVGSVAISVLAALGYSVTAFTGKTAQHDYLRDLGASDFIDRHSAEMGERPLEKALWGGAVDNAGGRTLSWLTRTVRPRGSIASIGLVEDHAFSTSVMPFILRGVSLLGVNVLEITVDERDTLWARLGDDLKPPQLARIVTREVAFDDLPGAFDGYFDGSHFGRAVVKIGD